METGVLAHFRWRRIGVPPFANRRMKFYPRTRTETQRAGPLEKKLLGRHPPRRPKRPPDPSCHHQLLLFVSSRAGTWSSRLIKEPLLSRYSGSAQVSVSGEKAR